MKPGDHDFSCKKNELFPHFPEKLNTFFKPFTDNFKYIGFANLAIAMDLKPYLQEIYVA